MAVSLHRLFSYVLGALVVTAAAHKSAPSVTSTAASSTLTGIAATAPTIGPSHQVGRLPALGWNSWNAYSCNINETKILDAADLFISLGLADAGYEYVNIDDCWPLETRDASTGRIVPDPSKFPSGISGVADQVHALGLKLGIYSDAGTNTCAGFPGSLGNETVDAEAFAEWGVDYLKYDNCNVPSNWTDAATPPDNDWYNSNSAIRYRQMTAALNQTGKPVHFSLCIWGDANVWEWGDRVGHSWRMTGDVSASWSSISSIIAANAQHLDSVDFFSHNDMDMMEIGNGDLTLEEQRTHFAAWAFLKSPILLGTDLNNLNSTQLDIIKNAQLLAFHQDPIVGTPATPFNATASAPSTSPPEFYAGKSSKGTHVFIINTNTTATKTFEFGNVPGLGFGRFRVQDMWTGKNLGTFANKFSITVDTHDTAALLIHRA
ncbi:glycoside hydrolase [Dichomitus squalens LYAD-421 SS1]|uniref:glycoside hydrolase n=1 Tax=Dichomitus squalens (strain LYAD-421) TaxID=732165 RepID=UPI0004412679|nr:glycoside hydrolase [Dichomitus squalens LYAD-421 SS1]EJF65552.1 glycoside hydrolase [Dichomitus squalens LYAD-421 SS1]